MVTQSGVSRRMALAAEAFGNKMCFLEDISAENVTPDLPSCLFVLEQALSVRALQEVVNSTNNSSVSSSKMVKISGLFGRLGRKLTFLIELFGLEFNLVQIQGYIK